MRQFRKTATTIAIIAMLSACEAPGYDRLDENKDLVRQFTTAINDADWNAFDDLLTEDFVRHSQATPDIRVRSREDFKSVQELFQSSVPDQNIRLEMLIAEADKVAAYAVYSGTQSGPMGNVPPTGRRFESRFLSIFRIEEGRIAELWVEWDNVAILTQLGVFPPPQEAAN